MNATSAPKQQAANDNVPQSSGGDAGHQYNEESDDELDMR